MIVWQHHITPSLTTFKLACQKLGKMVIKCICCSYFIIHVILCYSATVKFPFKAYELTEVLRYIIPGLLHYCPPRAFYTFAEWMLIVQLNEWIVVLHKSRKAEQHYILSEGINTYNSHCTFQIKMQKRHYNYKLY